MTTFAQETEIARRARPEWRQMVTALRAGRTEDAKTLGLSLGIAGNDLAELAWRVKCIPTWRKDAANLAKLTRDWDGLQATIANLRAQLDKARSAEERRAMRMELEPAEYRLMVSSPAYYGACRAASTLACAQQDGLCE